MDASERNCRQAMTMTRTRRTGPWTPSTFHASLASAKHRAVALIPMRLFRGESSDYASFPNALSSKF